MPVGKHPSDWKLAVLSGDSPGLPPVSWLQGSPRDSQPFREPVQDLPVAVTPYACALPHSSRSPTAPASQLDPWLLTETQAFAFVFLAHHVLLMLICLKPLSRLCVLTAAFSRTSVHIHSLHRPCSFLLCIFHPFHFSIRTLPHFLCLLLSDRIPISEAFALDSGYALSFSLLSPLFFPPRPRWVQQFLVLLHP